MPLNYAFSYHILKAINSFPQLEVISDLEWMFLNYAFSYDVILPHRIGTSNSSPQLEVSNDIEWGSLNCAFSYDVVNDGSP